MNESEIIRLGMSILKMTNIDDKKQTVLDALDELFGDIGVPKKVTLDALEEIQSETESKIDALKADIEHDVS